LRQLALHGRETLVEAVLRRGCDSREVAVETALDVWVLLIAASMLRGRRCGAAVEELTELLSVLLGQPFSVADQLLAADQTAELFARMQSEAYWDAWSDPTSAAAAYQYFSEPDLEVFRTAGGAKVPPELIGRRTQQFTDRWIAEFLVHNTVGRWWLAMHPDSRLASAMAYLVDQPAGRQTPLTSVGELKILDPACGTMNFGLAAFELLEAMYREELDRAGADGWPQSPSVRSEREIPQAILRNNLFGVDVDRRPLVLAAVGLYVRSGVSEPFALNLTLADALAERHPAGDGQYDVVLLNPPYLDRRDYPPPLKTAMKRRFPRSGRNLYTAFLERSLELVRPGGRLGAITPQTFMFISSLEPVRRWLTQHAAIETLVHTGLNTFDEAVVDCAFYVLRRNDPADPPADGAWFVRLTESDQNAQAKAHCLGRIIDEQRSGRSHPRLFHAHQAAFDRIPGSPWVYWAEAELHDAFTKFPALGDHAEIRQGLATTDNFRFVRYWWEIPDDQIAWNCRNAEEAARSGKRWFPYAKGGGFKRWYSRPEYLVDWEDDGRAIKREILRRYPYLRGKWQWVAKNVECYFQPGLSYSYLTSKTFSARILPGGCIFDVAGSAVFPKNPALVLAVLNSTACRRLLELINSTVNFQIGDLARLPIPRRGTDELAGLVARVAAIQKLRETFDETSLDFVAPPPWGGELRGLTAMAREQAALEHEIDRQVCGCYGLEVTEPDEIGDGVLPGMDLRQLAHRWVSYALGVVFGRFAPGLADRPGSGLYRLEGFDVPPVLRLDRVALAGLVDRHARPLEPSCDGLASAICREGRLSAANAIERILHVLTAILGASAAGEVVSALTPKQHLSDYLRSGFFPDHVKLYRNRPIYWVVKGEGTSPDLLYYHRLSVEHGSETPWRYFNPHDGILLNILPFQSRLADASYRAFLTKHAKAFAAGRYGWAGSAGRSRSIGSDT